MRSRRHGLGIVAVLAGASWAAGQPIGAEFTYQGQLRQGAGPFTGNADLLFELFDAGTNGNLLGTQTVMAVPVTQGLFTVVLNAGGEFGPDAFNGGMRWVQITVNGTLLAPRQPVTPAPYATTAAGLKLPFGAGASISGAMFSITNGHGNGRAVAGISTATGLQSPQPSGVYGESAASNGRGVWGVSQGGGPLSAGVMGSGPMRGVWGEATAAGSHGVLGRASGLTGVMHGGYFEALNSAGGVGAFGGGVDIGLQGVGADGVVGSSSIEDGNGVVGEAMTGEFAFGVWGRSNQGFGIYGESYQGGTGVHGKTSGAGNEPAGVSGSAVQTNGWGVLGDAHIGTFAIGVVGRSTAGTGVAGTSTSNAAVHGRSASHYGVVGVTGLSSAIGLGSFAKSGVLGDAQAGNGVIGVTNAVGGAGVLGVANHNNYGVFGHNLLGTAVYGISNNWAGFFQGPLFATSASAGVKAFRIDHPLDPEYRYLQHSSVESPDMKNVYDGVATLDADGAAWVTLPDYFEALNRDVRYQLTAMGGPAPGLHVADEVAGNRFRIAGGRAGQRVCWQVTGIRQDPAANLLRIEVEPLKSEADRGRYLVPEAYGLPIERAINFGGQGAAPAPGLAQR